MPKKLSKGFTLIELLITISIIGILSAIVGMSLANPQKAARDARRKSDLANYQVALEAYANAHGGLYPSFPTNSNLTTAVCPASLSPNFASSCPADPSSDRSYEYISNSNATQYVIWVNSNLESVTDSTWAICYDGTVGLVSSSSHGSFCSTISW